MAQALGSGHLSGDGPFTRRCGEVLRTEFGHEHALLTTSCTDALEMSSLLLELRPGDEVIVPSFTFVSTVNAFVLLGAKPVFVDVDPRTLNVDARTIQEHMTERTRAVVVVHYAGVGCDMDEITALAEAHSLMLIEDNAHGLGGSYRGRPLGSFGAVAALSFHETKNFTCGEGGALVVNDSSLLDRAQIIREKGTNRAQFILGKVDKYSWVDIGSSFLPADLLAAVLLAQLESKEHIEHRRKSIWTRYHQALGCWAHDWGIELPYVPADREQAYHMYYMLMPDTESRDLLIERLGQRGIQAVFHYLPLHLSQMGRRLGFREGDCPITENLCGRLVRLPFFTGLSPEDQDEVVTEVHAAVTGSTTRKPAIRL